MKHLVRSFKKLGVAMTLTSAMASLIACSSQTVIVVTATPTPLAESAAPATSEATAQPATEVPPTATALPAPPATPTNSATTNNTSNPSERVTFATGETSATRAGRLAKGTAYTYLLNANAGQTLSVSLFPDGAELNTFTIWSPSQQSWTANDVSYGGPAFARIITLPESGDYRVVVGPPAGETNPSTYQVTFMILNSSAQAPSEPPVRMQFAAGASEATVEGSMPMGGGSARYVLGAGAGQLMTVRSSSTFVPVDFRVKAPSGTVWTSQQLGTEGYLFSQSILLPEAGDYVVTLNTPAGYDATTFMLNVAIENAEALNPVPLRIQFQPGATSATVKGSVGMNGRVKYVLGAAAGQLMHVTLHGSADSVGMRISSPRGLLADAVTDWSGTLPATGDYEIDLYSTLGIFDKEYSLDVSIVSNAEASPPPPLRIQFQPGATSATVKGSVGMNGHVKYVLGAAAGQLMHVTLYGPADSVGMRIFSPGALLADAVMNWSGTLPATGDYEIDVYSTLGIFDKEYTLDVSINSQSSDGSSNNGISVTRSLNSSGTTVFTFNGPVDDNGFMNISSIDVAANGKTARIAVTAETQTPINEPFSLETEDMNYDGLDDFRVVRFLPAGPNLPYLYFIYDASDNTFHYNPAYDEITTPVFLADGTIQSSWRAGAGDWGISDYVIFEGSPVLQKIESWESTDGEQATHKVETFDPATGSSEVILEEIVSIP